MKTTDSLCAALVFLTLSAALPLNAQNGNDYFQEAEKAYGIGRFEYVDSLLRDRVGLLGSGQTVRAYRLLTLSSMYLDRDAQAEQYAAKLLSIDPYYTAYGDTPRFSALIERIKAGKAATITTASQQAETLEEAPVPVTLITAEMIRSSSARTVGELLNLYVPGVFPVEGEEANFSMRGMFGYSQEEVLFLLDGVRLNSYSTHSFAPDYRLNLNNIKQIEVLRGSASSLYGNVALSAVVNIITKSGSDVNGLQVSAAGGTASTYEGSLLFGKKVADSDVLVWASMYSSKGYRHDIPAADPEDGYGLAPIPGQIYINGYNKMPAYDLGLNLKWKHFDFLAAHTYGKRSYAYNNLLFPSMYCADKYTTAYGISPGRGVASSNINARYSNKWGGWGFEGNIYGNHESTSMLNIFGDIVPAEIGFWADQSWLQPDDDPTVFDNFPQGQFQGQSWKDFNLGANFKALVDYNFLGHGNFLLGTQFDYFKSYYNDMIMGAGFDRILITRANGRSPLLQNASESTNSVFFQFKHYFTQKLIFNGGLRFDDKNRYNGVSKGVLSPRVALIWNPTANQNYKLSYGRSFVDAPFFYRASKYIYTGNESLNPQYLNNVQFSGTVKIPVAHLVYEGNIFYNHVQDVIVLGDWEYENAGVVHSAGLENILTFHYRGWTAGANLYLQKLLNSECIKAADNYIFSVPNLGARLNLSKEILKGLSLNTQMYFNGKTKCMLPPYAMIGGEPIAETEHTFPSVFIMDMGLRYRRSVLEFYLKAKNITNSRYRLGGDRVPVLQEGFSLLGGVTLHFSK